MEDKSIIIVPEKVSWNDERVLTTAQLAEYYECDPKHIQQNYNNNVDRFISGKHFYRLEGEALRAFKREFENFEVAAPQLNLLYLWTKRGAARHAKMLNTDKAWEVFEALEDNYFDRPAIAPDKTTSELATFEHYKSPIRRADFLQKKNLLHERDCSLTTSLACDKLSL